MSHTKCAGNGPEDIRVRHPGTARGSGERRIQLFVMNASIKTAQSNLRKQGTQTSKQLLTNKVSL